MNTPEQSPELLALADALAGIAPPCFVDPETWFEDRTTAARLCRERCHALSECAAYAATIAPSYGVWAGVDYDRRPTHRRSA